MDTAMPDVLARHALLAAASPSWVSRLLSVHKSCGPSSPRGHCALISVEWVLRGPCRSYGGASKRMQQMPGLCVGNSA